MQSIRIAQLLLACSLVLSSMLLANCGEASLGRQAAAPLERATAPTVGVPQTASTTTSVPPASSADMLYVLDGSHGDTQLVLVDATSTQPARSRPLGVVAPDAATVYTAQQTYRATGQHSTTLHAVDLASGATLRSQRVDGGYALPTLGFAGLPDGLSANGRWLVLQDPARASRSPESRFLVLDTSLAAPPRTVTLPGYFAFDAINNTGDALYLLEYASDDTAGLYHVRHYDLAQGALDPQVVVAKGETAVMEGQQLAALTAPDGQWRYSLYLNSTQGPFIHALNLDTRLAICIDLPTQAKDNWEQQLFWAIALAPDGERLYAANGALGLVAELDLRSVPQQLRRSITLSPAAQRAPDALTQLGDWLVPTVAAKRIVLGGATLGAEGKLLFALAEEGVLAIDTATLTLRGRYLEGWPLDSIAASPDGQRLYVTSVARGVLATLDAATEMRVSEIIGVRQPWAVLRVVTPPSVAQRRGMIRP